MEINNFNIAVLSGKGGTGKTMLSVNLASIAENSRYIDCDIEEPNGHLFFKPENIETEEIKIQIPYVNDKFCTGCRKCVDFCKFNALAYVNRLLIFEEVCHSCGGCVLLCPENALKEKAKTVGIIQKGVSENVTVVSGVMNVGEVSGVPIIKRLLKYLIKDKCINIIDCPPGSACAVMESIKDADFCILVAEPTIFGVHNLNMVYELVNKFNKPFGVIINKCLGGDNPVENYCYHKNIKILGKIPFDENLGKINSNAEIAVRVNEKYKELFNNLLDTIIKEVKV